MVAESMKHLLPILCFLLAFALTCSLANAYSETIELKGGASKTRTVNLNTGDEISGRVTIVGVQHYIFGFPQEYILLFIIVGLSLVAVVVFAAMSPKP